MKFQLALMSLFASSALSICNYDGRSCFWDGSAPSCGSTSYKLRQTGEKGDELVATTEFESAGAMCERIKGHSTSCCEEYGGGCWSGYKRLWCLPLGLATSLHEPISFSLNADNLFIVKPIASLPANLLLWRKSLQGPPPLRSLSVVSIPTSRAFVKLFRT